MPRNITAAPKHALDFCTTDTLAQTNQIKYECCFFFTWHKKPKKLFSQDLKVETKIPGTFLYCCLTSQWKHSEKKKKN